MRVFALEYATGGGILERPWLAACRAEGDAMLRALVADLAEIPGVSVDVVLDDAVGREWPGEAMRVRRVRHRSAVRPSWDAVAVEVDAVWPVAPETDGILAGITVWAEAGGRALLASRSRAVEIAGSKRRTAALLADNGVRTVPTYSSDAVGVVDGGQGWVAKPDDGVGGDGAHCFATLGEARRQADEAPAGKIVIQPLLAGTPISISMLAQRGEAWLLACNVQDVRRERDTFVYRGGWVGAAEELRAALEPVAAAVASALPELWGYVGVDLVATADGPVVLEINPRLTTSYAGLRRSIGVNPAALIVRLLDTPLASLVRPLSPRPVHVTIEAAS